MSNIKTGLMFSPLTERVFWGKVNQKTGAAVGSNKKDITSDFIGIMLQKFPKGTRQNITAGGETEAVVIVVDEDVAGRFERSKEVEAQRDELLEALKALLEVQHATEIGFKEREEAIAAIAKAEGGE